MKAPLEHEHRSKARPAARSLGHLEGGAEDLLLEKLPLDELAHAQQRSLEGGDIEILHEHVEETRLAKSNELRHARPCPPIAQNAILVLN